jgi:lycopene beta-cyclase
VTPFDFAIIGSGLSGLLHADQLLEASGPELKIALIDPDPQSLAQKTFSSWIPRSAPPHRYSHLISNTWDQFRITSPQCQTLQRRFGGYRYERIPGASLLEHFETRRAGDPRLVRITATVTRIHADQPGHRCLELSTRQTLSARKILNSAATPPAGSVLQYFVGLEIETDRDAFDPSVADLMDFRVPQQDSVRFVYVLPFSSRRALVEFTVFSSEKLPDQECEHLLKDYLSGKLGLESYRVLGRESGVIPMSTELSPLFPPSFGNRSVESIGSAAGRIKPCTGYSFQRNLRAPGNPGSFRFQLYDSLLLGILRQSGGLGAGIFYRLFEKNPPERVFSFLDENTRPIDEARIFWTLPWRPFLKQLLLQQPFIFAAGGSLLLHHAAGGAFGWGIPLLGLATTGIGHGSIDHLLKPGIQPASRFYLNYLGRIAAFLAAWRLAPQATLAFFIFQSADHFGEAQWPLAIRLSKNHPGVRAASAIWGLFAALFSVLFHWNEALPILQALIGVSDFLMAISETHARAAAMILLVAAIASATVLGRYEKRASGNNRGGPASTLILAAAFMALPLLQGFLCFFAFWHGWDSVLAQKDRKRWSAPQHLRQALPYTLLSLAGAASLLWLAHGWQVLFIAIGALTAAHAPVMSRFLRHP